MAPAMKPDEALQQIAQVRAYREGHTSRAAGIVWLVWGLGLALLLSIGTSMGKSPPELPLAISMGLAQLFVLAAAAMATNLVWRSQSLGRERPFPRWVPYVGSLGIVLAISGVLAGLQQVVDAGWVPGLLSAPLLLITSLAALGLSLLQGSKVRRLPGLVASLGVFALFWVAALVPWHAGFESAASLLLTIFPLLAFTPVGVWHFRNG